MLPFLTGSKAKREMQREFRGLNRRPGAAENEFAAMENMTGAGYPLLASRSPRGRVRKLTKIDPLNQRSACGWKATKAAKRLVEEYMVRIESCSSYSSEVAAN